MRRLLDATVWASRPRQQIWPKSTPGIESNENGNRRDNGARRNARGKIHKRCSGEWFENGMPIVGSVMSMARLTLCCVTPSPLATCRLTNMIEP
jgi:hypothetical protein